MAKRTRMYVQSFVYILFASVCLLFALFLGVYGIGKSAFRYNSPGEKIFSKLYNLSAEQQHYLRKTYGPISKKIPFNRVPRELIPELEPILKEILPLYEVQPNLNLTELFPRDGIDLMLQKQANKSDLSQEEYDTLAFYESVLAAQNNLQHPEEQRKKKKNLDLYEKYSVPETMVASFEDTDPWKLSSGRLIHIGLSQGENPLSLKFFEKHRVKLTGLFYYPPGGYAEWHTNRHHTLGWRLYFVKTLEPGRSWFRYKHVPSGEIVHVEPDGAEQYNLFCLRGEPDQLLWHSVYSDTHRFSVGINVHPMLAYLVLSRLYNDSEISFSPSSLVEERNE